MIYPDSWFLCIVECLIEKDGKILLIRRPEGSFNGGLLSFPGGKVERSVDGGEGEDILRRAATREVFEEVGLTLLDPIHYLLSAQFPGQDNIPILETLFFCQLKDTKVEVKISAREASEYLWLSPAEIQQHPDAPMWLQRFVDTYTRR